jgi:hypothetical protein
MSYDWDLFISYPRRDPLGPWVQDRLFPLLDRWLGAQMRSAPRLFIDTAMEDGTDWPSHLRESLHRSKYLVAVLAPPYFGSRWCVAEWHTMRQRQAFLGLGVGQVPGLIQPIRFIDGETFPQDAKDLQDGHSDYQTFNTLPPGKKTPRSKGYKEFENKVQLLCERLAKRIAETPHWRDDWPRLERPPEPPASPRLSFAKVGL